MGCWIDIIAMNMAEKVVEGRNLGLTLMSIRSQEGLSGRRDRINRSHHALRARMEQPASLWYAEQTPEFYQRRLVEGLFGAGLDHPVIGRAMEVPIIGLGTKMTAADWEDIRNIAALARFTDQLARMTDEQFNLFAEQSDSEKPT